jgi:hypothetical protein
VLEAKYAESKQSMKNLPHSVLMEKGAAFCRVEPLSSVQRVESR